MRRLLISAALLGAVFTAAIASAEPPLHVAKPASAKASVAQDMMAARLATAKYVSNLSRAKADGYGIITKMIPNMGWHFLNPKITKFNLRKPPILVYERHGKGWQLGALEWVFPSIPSKAPLPGAKYGVFGAACHYLDGTFVFQTDKTKCAAHNPQTGAKFNFWHPRLVTLHFWVWYPNPAGVYSGLNRNVHGFNHS